MAMPRVAKHVSDMIKKRRRMKAITSAKDTTGAGRNSGGGVLSRFTQLSVVCCSISVPTLVVEVRRR
jgi:hypothetical protein